MFGRRKRQQLVFDREKQTPVVRKSICTGEETAGFRDRDTGAFHEVMLLKNEKDLAEFMELCGITDPPETIF